jgi:hypothetical protein
MFTRIFLFLLLENLSILNKSCQKPTFAMSLRSFLDGRFAYANAPQEKTAKVY